MKAHPLLLSLFLVPSFACAQSLIVDWGGDYVTSEQTSQIGSTLTQGEFGGTPGTPLDSKNSLISLTGTPINPTIGGSYSGTSSVFYGGTEAIVFDNTGNEPFSNVKVTDFSPDRIESGNGVLGGSLNLSTSLFLWRSADFIGGGSYTVGDLTEIASTNVGFTSQMRWVIQADSQYYLSDDFQGLNATNTLTSFTGANQWGLYDPTDNNTLYPETITLNQTLTDGQTVDAVGIIRASDTNNLKFNSFEVTAIPEPSVSGFLLGLVSLCVIARRRRE